MLRCKKSVESGFYFAPMCAAAANTNETKQQVCFAAAGAATFAIPIPPNEGVCRFESTIR